MLEQNPHSNPDDPSQDRLSAALRREAARERPQFSDPLHERVMSSVRESPRPALPVRSAGAHPFQSWKMWAAAFVLATLAGLAINLLTKKQDIANRVAVPPAKETPRAMNADDLNTLMALLITARRKEPLAA